jgi:glutaminyl-peptide cyclotransferase
MSLRILSSFLILCCGVGLALTSKIDYKVLRRFEHDHKSFTQGLILKDGYIYESGGLYRLSTLRRVDANTGQVLQKTAIPKRYFAEGIVIVGDYLYMLTWREKTMLIFDYKTLTLLDTRKYKTFSGQGWGICHDGKNLWASDGSHVLTKWKVPDVNAETTLAKKSSLSVPWDNKSKYDELEKVSELHVTKNGHPVKLINDLEYVNGFIYANIWYQDIIIKIDPNTGVVLSELELHDLYPKHTRTKTADCLNGIAYNETDSTFLLTGKLWPMYYKTKFYETSGDWAAGVNIDGMP